MRLLIVLLGAALLVLQLRLWVSAGGMREVWRLTEQMALRTEENRLLAERNDALEAEVQDLKKGLAAAEERARSELGMVLPDEIFYQIMPARAAEAPPARRRRRDADRAPGISADTRAADATSGPLEVLGRASDPLPPEGNAADVRVLEPTAEPAP
jgi:cell division protein FtsB